MSASLVGSEMCIRDRIRISFCDERRQLLESLRGGYRPPGPPLVGASGAVSYTHLTLPTICSV
eukprot:12680989-Alexandrium_andersonii.AAC.1